MSPRVAVLSEGQWYEDTSTRYRWRIVALHALTVDVVDSWGNRTTHNRIMWETGEMRPVDGADPAAKRVTRTPL